VGQVSQETEAGRYGQGIQDILLRLQQRPIGAKERWVISLKVGLCFAYPSTSSVGWKRVDVEEHWFHGWSPDNK
jgi:hypothetical protein